MRAALRFAKEHPVITTVMVVCTLLGTALGALFLPGDWPAWRRVAAGTLSGCGVGLLITAPRVIGW